MFGNPRFNLTCCLLILISALQYTHEFTAIPTSIRTSKRIVRKNTKTKYIASKTFHEKIMITIPNDHDHTFLSLAIDPASASAIASKLYPAAMIGTIGELYFRTRKEMESPRGSVVGYTAQIITIILSIPMIAVAKNAPGVQSFLEVDWLHFIETFLFWASIHVQTMSFRQAVLAVERKEPLPKSVISYRPMAINTIFLFLTAFILATAHYQYDATTWQNTPLFGGYLTPPTPNESIAHLPGELSYTTWIFHWSMVIDYLVMLLYMWRWGDVDCTGNEKWKSFALMNILSCVINGVVIINHFHRDRLVVLKVIHPLLVFIGSIVTMVGSFAVARANGWSVFGGTDRMKTVGQGFSSLLLEAKENSNGVVRTVKDWDNSYTLASVLVGAVFSYFSLFLVA
ncbi:hypothetical protein ACHAXS_004079 [Conticribra weissflogii]